MEVRYSLTITSADEGKITTALSYVLPLLTKEVEAKIHLKHVSTTKQQVDDEK